MYGNSKAIYIKNNRKIIMIIFGHPIHRKHTKRMFKLVILVLVLVVSLALFGCSKLEFDPRTSIIKYIIKNGEK